MNTTGCPPGYATDAMFQPAVLTCDVKLEVFLGLTIALAVFRSLVAGMRVFVWWQRHVHGTGKRSAGQAQPQPQQHAEQTQTMATATPTTPTSASPTGPKRWPLTPLLSVTVAVTQIFAVPLAYYNVINFYNGFAHFVYSFAYLPSALYAAVTAHIAIKLGARIVPVMGKRMDAPALRRADAFGRFTFVAQTVCVLGTIVVFSVLSPAVPSHEEELAITGFALKFFFHVNLTLSIVWFLQRVIAAVRLHQRLMAKNRTEEDEKLHQNANTGAQSRAATMREFDAAVAKLRRNQLVVFGGFFLPGVFFLLLAVRALPWSYVFVYVIPGALEAVGLGTDDAFYLWRRYGCGRAKRGGGDSQSRPQTHGASTTPRHLGANHQPGPSGGGSLVPFASSSTSLPVSPVRASHHQEAP